MYANLIITTVLKNTTGLMDAANNKTSIINTR